MSFEWLCVLWFVLLGCFLAGYAILDGFDLGVGMLHPFVARTDTERRISLNAIGPIWDGNEVWLIVYGGALFAAFPEVYATVFSGFYTAFMLVLCGLILRAVSLEFRGKIAAAHWRRFWDGGFFLGSLLTTLVFGVAVGNAMMGVPLDARGLYWGSFFDLLTPYPLLVGAFTVSMFVLHGGLFLFLKTPPSAMHDRLGAWLWHGWGVFLTLYLILTVVTLITIPRATANFEHHPWALAIVVLDVLAVVNIPRCVHANRPGQAFLSSCLAITGFVFLFSFALYPNLVTSRMEPANSLTIYNTASSQGTLMIMTIIALIGAPLVLIYTAAVYWTFRGKVRLDEHSY